MVSELHIDHEIHVMPLFYQELSLGQVFNFPLWRVEKTRFSVKHKTVKFT